MDLLNVLLLATATTFVLVGPVCAVINAKRFFNGYDEESLSTLLLGVYLTISGIFMFVFFDYIRFHLWTLRIFLVFGIVVVFLYYLFKSMIPEEKKTQQQQRSSVYFVSPRSRNDSVGSRRSGVFEGIAEEATWGKHGSSESEAVWNFANSDRGQMIENTIYWNDGTKSSYGGSFGWDHPGGHHIEYDD